MHCLARASASGPNVIASDALPLSRAGRRVQHAYSVLSNPKLRSIYDSYGEQGLRMYESYTSFAEGSSDDGGGPTMVPLSPVQLASIICGAIGLLVCLFTALCVDVLLKLNGSTDASLSLLWRRSDWPCSQP